ncbi:MAG: aminotransferase class V-fold PLP-dependent enzyme [Oscillospiraceae bacterium]|jgi:cysteine desulfurase|nr:aminotransferase class V-fold PLP-dependent enzyme [Oscillospiraceae bacterium]
MRVYFDNAATTPVSETAKKAMLRILEDVPGNPSSLHTFGQEAARELALAREKCALALGCTPKEIYFTSGGSEADNQAIRSGAYAGAKKGKHRLISTAIEHHAVLHTLDALKAEGFEVVLLPVDPDSGIISLQDLENALTPDTAFVTIMLANNEIGSIQPVKEAAAICKKHGVPIHTDAVQAVGHIAVNVKDLGVDALSLSGHKFHGPKGVGVLYAKTGFPLTPLIQGGTQERNRRAGTENIPGIVGMAAAIEEAVGEIENEMPHICAMRDRIIHELSALDKCRLNGDPVLRLPNNVNFCFEGLEGESLLLLLDAKGIAASSGSACTSGSLDPSHVLLALGLPHEIAHGSLRITLSRYTTEEEVDYLLEVLPPIVAQLREMSPVW